MLKYVFTDRDHELYTDQGLIRTYVKNNEEHKNIIINSENTRGVVFDFDLALNPLMESNIYNSEGVNRFMKQVHESISAYSESYVEQRKLMEKVHAKCQAFLNMEFKDDTFFNAVLKKTETDLLSQEFEAFFYYMGEFGAIKKNNLDASERAKIMFLDIHKRLILLAAATEVNTDEKVNTFN